MLYLNGRVIWYYGVLNDWVPVSTTGSVAGTIGQEWASGTAGTVVSSSVQSVEKKRTLLIRDGGD